MTSTNQSFDQLSDDVLLATVKRLALTERRATAALVRSLMELDVRRLYLGEGYSSLFTYCTQALHLAEGAAYNRIEAARAARRFPAVLKALDDGSVTLTALRLLAPHLTPDNHQDVLASARYKGKREIEVLVASLRPMPAVASTIRKLPEPRRVLLDATCDTALTVVAPRSAVVAPTITTSTSTIAPLAPERYKVQFTISRDTQEKLRRVQALARHAIPSGDLAEIFDRAITLLLRELECRRRAAVTAPRAAHGAVGDSRHVPAFVKREVWRRDDGRCAFTGRDGRCTERSLLEYHHVQPYAAGGAATAANIELRCRARVLSPRGSRAPRARGAEPAPIEPAEPKPPEPANLLNPRTETS
jgi:5-methylcytosine-specific restriction endonuclease McrA